MSETSVPASSGARSIARRQAMVSLARALWREERSDLLLLGMVTLSVLGTWVSLLSWGLDDLIPGNDSHAHLPWFQELWREDGNWRALTYFPRMSAGVRLHDTLGTAPIHQVLAWLGMGPGAMLNGTMLALQVAIGYLGIRLARDLRPFPRPPLDDRWTARLMEVFGVWVLAFAPALGWRIGYCHWNLLAGHTVFMAGAALIAASRQTTLNATLTIVGGIVVANGLGTFGYQAVIYGAIFGSPILIALAVVGRGPAPARLLATGRVMLVPALLGAGALLLISPRLTGMLDFAHSSDALRRIGEGEYIYRWTTQRLQDWISSIPLANELFGSGRALAHQHETNYPLGPIVLLAFAAGGLRARYLRALSLIVGFVLIGLSSNVRPFSTWLPEWLPVLNNFRVPARAMPMLLHVLGALGLTTLLSHRGAPVSRRGWVTTAVGCVGALATVWMLPPGWREGLCWMVVGGWLLARKRKSHHALALITLCVLGATTVASFKERLILPYRSIEAVTQWPMEQGMRLRRLEPRLTSRLERVRLRQRHPDLDVNIASMMGISSLDGNTGGLRRFAHLYDRLHGKALRRTNISFRFAKDTAGNRVMQQLFNVSWNLWDVATIPRLVPVAEDEQPVGPAWFAWRIEWAATMHQLARELLDLEDLRATVAETLYLVANDPWVRAGEVPSQLPLQCQEATIDAITAPHEWGPIVLDVSSPASCVLTVSTAFAENLEARTTAGAFPTLPVYGALLGIVVPTGSHRIEISARPTMPTWTLFAQVMGALLFFAVTLVSARQSVLRGCRGTRATSPS